MNADEFVRTATWYGPLDAAAEQFALDPGAAGGTMAVAAILGDHEEITRLITRDANAATAAAGALQWPPLLYVTMSKFLRLKPERSDHLLRAATVLLDAGADPNVGVVINGENETPLYGAAGVAGHVEMTKLLLSRGANPNDIEVVYHTPETYDNGALQVILETGRMTEEDLALMLIRKADWHDIEGLKMILAHNANANSDLWRGRRPLHHAIMRANGLANIETLVNAGADPMATSTPSGESAVTLAARRGRADLLALFESRGFPIPDRGVAGLIVACARNDLAIVNAAPAAQPDAVRELLADGASLLSEFASNGNANGIDCLIALGVPVDAPYSGDGYFGIPSNSTALHVAAWRGWPAAVNALIAHGANVNARDGNGMTPLLLAIRACTDSYWMIRRSPVSVTALLDAGANTDRVTLPTGYDEIDRVLAGR